MARSEAITEEAQSPATAEAVRSAEELLGEAEPWESWETKLVLYSVGLALVGLVILGFLINTFILN
jgi:hypothetical protein